MSEWLIAFLVPSNVLQDRDYFSFEQRGIRWSINKNFRWIRFVGWRKLELVILSAVEEREVRKRKRERERERDKKEPFWRPNGNSFPAILYQGTWFKPAIEFFTGTVRSVCRRDCFPVRSSAPRCGYSKWESRPLSASLPLNCQLSVFAYTCLKVSNPLTTVSFQLT